MITFATFFKEHSRLEKQIADFASKSEVNEVYYSARQFLDQISIKAVNDKAARVDAYAYYTHSGTVRLKKLLATYTDFDEADIVHFNGFSLIDSVMASRK